MKKILAYFSTFKFFAIITTLMILMLIYETIINKSSSVINSISFIVLTIALFINIFFCSLLRILNRIKTPIHYWLIHAGILVVIAGFILSSLFSFKADMFVLKGQEEIFAYDEKNEMYRVPFRIRLNDFKIEYYKEPVPYLVYKNNIKVEEGKIIKLNGNEYKIERFFNDFIMYENGNYSNKTEFFNNPAVLISYEKEGKKEKIWVFEARGERNNSIFSLKIENSDIKDFISDITILYEGKEHNAKVSVNKPYKFMDYKIYQTSFDPAYEKNSIFTVKKDVFVPLVFTGFIVMLTGVILWII